MRKGTLKNINSLPITTQVLEPGNPLGPSNICATKVEIIQDKGQYEEGVGVCSGTS